MPNISDALNPDPCARCFHSCDAVLSRRELLTRAAAAVGLVLAVPLLDGCGAPNADNGAPAATGPATVAAKAEGASFRVPGGGKLKPNAVLPFSGGPGDKGGFVLADAKGELHALSAVCTHAGCEVAWSGEGPPHLHCPCHGSNFDFAGAVLNGPAKKPLARFKVTKSGSDALVSPA